MRPIRIFWSILALWSFAAQGQLLNNPAWMRTSGSSGTGGGGGGGGQTITDDFGSGTSADLGVAWTPVDDSFKIASGVAVANAGGSDAAEVYTGVTWSANQSAEVTISGVAWAGGAGAGYGVGVRWSSSQIKGYRLVINSAGNWEVLWFNNPASTVITSGTTTYVSGAVLKLSIIGTTLAGTYNGASIFSVTDANLATGSPAICHSSSTTGGTCDSWTGVDGL